MFKVQAKQCESCIYRPNSPLDIKNLERQIADPRMAGHFTKFRACHHASKEVCCRGFWNRHKNHFDLGQLAQRLKMVTFVTVDTLARRQKKEGLSRPTKEPSESRAPDTFTTRRRMLRREYRLRRFLGRSKG